jgi:type VI secretion system secreted protein VgrG
VICIAGRRAITTTSGEFSIMNVPLPGGLFGLGAELASRLKASLSIGQSTRLIQIETPFSSGTLVVERFTLTEGVHADEPMWAELDCISTNAHLELKALIGEQVTLRLMQADGTWRNWHGYVVRAGQMGSDGGLGSYRLQLAAFTHWLKHRRDTRIFQDATSADIVSAVLSAYLQARFQIDVADPGPMHEITTQHRETDWAFVTRLMAREGWSWRVDHDGSAEGAIAGPRAAKHTLVIFDHNAKRPDLGALRFSRPDMRGSGPDGLMAAISQAFNLTTGLAQDTITAWRVGQQVGTNAVTLAAWDERQLAGVSAQHSLVGSADIALGNVPTLEHYSGQGERRYADGRVGTAQPASNQTADARARAWMAAHQLHQILISGQSAVRALSPGISFQMTEHSLYDKGFDGRADNAFCALGITHEAANNLGQQAAQILQRTDVEQGSYRNEFDAAPAAARLAPHPLAQPTAPGPQTAIVMAAKGEPLMTDRNHRIRIQFGWQRGMAPLAGALTAPQTLGGGDTGHAPGNAQSGTWVRVAQGVAGPNWGAVFTPRAGTEVLVDYLDGDIDRPIVIGQLHNGQHDMPWPAGVDSSANHPGTISGWHSPHLDGQGANQWLIDDAAGQLRMRLLNYSARTGYSELTLGHIIQQSAQGGAGHAQRGQWLGEGFYGFTEGWAVLRAGEGMLMSTTTRSARGASVTSTQMDASEAVAQLRAGAQLGDALSQSARQQGALGLSSHDADQAMQQHTDAMDPKVKGRYAGSVGGQDARKAQSGGRVLGDPVEKFAKPLLHLDTPASAVWVTPASIGIFSGGDSSLTMQGDAHLTSAHTVSSVSGQTTSLYTHAGGIKAITANADLSLRAHTDAMQIWADKDITVQSTTDEIRIQAKDSIAINAGQSQILLKDGDITMTCPGAWTVKGATHDWMGAGTGPASMQALPDTRVKLFDEQIRAVSKASGKPVAHQSYAIKLPDGASHQGVTDDEGKTARIATATPEDIKLTWLAEVDTDHFPDVPVDEGC